MIERRCSVRHVIALLVALSSSAGAQARGDVVGQVRDSAGLPIASAHVAATGRYTLSDSAGRFLLRALPAGRIAVTVRRLGFEPGETTLVVVEGREQPLIVVLVALPLDLPAVTARAYATRLVDFNRHRETGGGRYFDRAQIEKSHAQLTSDLLRRVPGVEMLTDQSGRPVLRMRRSARGCPPDYWVDGIRAQGLGVDDLPIGDIEALEVYSGPAGLPPEYMNRLGNPGCGAIVIWTRLPG